MNDLLDHSTDENLNLSDCAGETSKPSHSSGENSNPNHSAGETSNPSHSAGETSNPSHSACENSNPSHSAGENSNPSHSAGETSNPSHSAGENSNPSHSAGENSNPSHSAGETSNPNHSAGETSNPNHSAGETSNPSHSAGETSNPSHSAGETSNPSHSAGENSNLFVENPNDRTKIDMTSEVVEVDQELPVNENILEYGFVLSNMFSNLNLVQLPYDDELANANTLKDDDEKNLDELWNLNTLTDEGEQEVIELDHNQLDDITPFWLDDELFSETCSTYKNLVKTSDRLEEPKEVCKCEEYIANNKHEMCPYCTLLRLNTHSSNEPRSTNKYKYFYDAIAQSRDLMEHSTAWLSELSYRAYKEFKFPIDLNDYDLEESLLKTATIEKKDDVLCSGDSDKIAHLNVEDFHKVFNIYDRNDEENANHEYLEHDLVLTDLETTSNHKRIYFEALPSEIKLKIFSYFTQRQLCRYVAPVCSSWFELSKDPTFWQSITYSEFEDVPSDLLVCVIVSWCKHITELELKCRSDITVADFREIFQNCPDIQHVSVAFCTQINQEILHLFLTYCQSLTSVNLEGCNQITDKSFYSFIGLPLTSICVSHCNQLSDDGGIFLLKHFKDLKEVNFDGIQWMTEEFVQVLVDNHCETLEKVYLDGENLTDNAIRLLSRCKSLRTLRFSFCNSMSHHALEWVGQCENLSSLQLRKGSNFTNSSLLDYLKNMGNVQGENFKFLNLAECTEISDECLFHLAERCPHLKILDLSWCWEVSDDGLAFIIDACHDLKELYLRGLYELYGTPFLRITSSLPKLTYMDLSQCNKVQDELIERLVQQMKELVIVNYYGECVANERHSRLNSITGSFTVR